MDDVYGITAVAPRDIGIVWDHIEPYFEKLAVKSDSIDGAYEIMQKVESGALSLWVIHAPGKILGFYTLGIFEGRGARTCSVVHCAGEAMPGWIVLMMDSVKEYALSQGCSDVEVSGRPGWSKFYKKHENLRGHKVSEVYKFKIKE
jgi:hypothetical protein